MNLQIAASEDRPPSVLVADLIEKHGRLVVIAVLVRGIVRHRRKVLAGPHDLSAHMQRDIGLDPVLPSRRHWDFL